MGYTIVAIIIMAWVVVDCVAGIQRRIEKNRDSAKRIEQMSRSSV